MFFDLSHFELIANTMFFFFCEPLSFSVDKFKKIDEEFTKCNTFLVSCLANIVKRGAFPHCKLTFFVKYLFEPITLLCKNHFFFKIANNVMSKLEVITFYRMPPL